MICFIFGKRTVRAKVPACLSSILVPMKPSPVTTDYIHLILEILDPEYSNIIFGGADRLNKLAKIVLIRIRLSINTFQEQVRYLL